MKKRILPALLALCMVMSLLPVTFAADPAPESKPNSIGIPDAGTTTSADGKTVTVIVHDASLANKHTCNLDGCTCITVTTKVETTGTGDEAVTTTTKTYSYAMCAVCLASATCNPCTGKAGCATQGLHSADCPESCSKAEGGVKGCTKAAGHEGAHNSSVCTKDADCGASTHAAGCPQKCYYCSNTKGATTVTVNGQTKYICDTCKNDATKNPCGYGAEGGKCTLPAGHAGAHNNSKCPGSTDTGKNGKLCGAKTHETGCADKCDLNADAVKADGTKDSSDKQTCNLTKGHEGVHNNAKCIGDAKCGAGTHFAGVAVTEENKNSVTDSDEDGWVDDKEPCPNASTAASPAKTCGVGGCTRPKGHAGNHNNPKCLGYNDDGYCGVAAGEHIAGCKQYVECTCSGHTYDVSGESGKTAWKNGTFSASAACTGKVGCAHCAEWNAFVASIRTKYNAQKALYDAADASGKAAANPGDWPNTLKECDCVACAAPKTNPGMGAVVDAEGNEVDPADPKPEIPTKAEDFKDADKMDDWMKEAAQVMLDKGWMQGTTEGNFDPREDADTNVVLTVIARMDGETITGATWADDAKAWAEENELTEGIEITKSDIARKDIVLMLWRLAGKPGSEQALDDFTDVDELKDDHLTAMKWAVEKKIVLGNGDGTVTPDGTLKRAELAAMVARYAALEK